MAVDPPGRVARLSYVEGAVSYASADAGDWTDAVLNRPLTSGDRLWLDEDARAELEVGSTTLHLDRETAFGVVKLDDGVLLASLTEGAASIRVRSLGDQEAIQVETPNATVRIRRADAAVLDKRVAVAPVLPGVGARGVAGDALERGPQRAQAPAPGP